MRALIVDDDPDIREVIADVLVDEGWDVETAADGKEALQRVQAQPPDLILLDYQMPRWDGPRFVAAYHQLPAPHAPIVLITAAVSAPQRAAEVGADAYLGKPFEVEALVTMVERYAA
jgi:CheY-like chemotaxis protein